MTESPASSPDRTAVGVEHYCTLFDHHFLPQGLALHASLVQHDPSCVLWILCVDAETSATLRRLSLPGVRVVDRPDVESPDVLAVRDSRTLGEYCWTLASVLIAHLLERYDEIGRITYIDADCCFFSSPRRILAELDAKDKDVLITPHAYTPRYDLSEQSGIYCVQFVTFGRSEAARQLLWRWRSQVVEWCFDRCEPGRFSDQKYLDPWPEQYPDAVHVLQDVHLAMAPWNVERFADRVDDPCMFHFHKFRLTGPGRAVLFDGFRVGSAVVATIYQPYLEAVARIIAMLGEGWDGYLPERTPSLGGRVSNAILRMQGVRRGARFTSGAAAP